MDNLGKDIIDMYKPYHSQNHKYINYTVGKQIIEIYDPFLPICQIGKGAYSIVFAAEQKNQQPKLKVIKKINKAFEHKVYARRILRQLKFLKLLKHQNIIELQTIILPKSRTEFNDIYLIFEIMDQDLWAFLKGKQKLSNEEYQGYQCLLWYQLLKGLKYIHSAGAVHRDLKPRNILVNKNGYLKICDFGLARSLDEKTKANILTEYVTTRWYRAPELILGANDYTQAVDMWSVGCIFAQMLNGKPFLPGIDAKSQLQLICQNIEISNIESLNLNYKSKECLKQILKNKHPKKLEKTFGNASPLALDLLKKLLVFNPNERITAQNALKHPYFSQIHDIETQTIRQHLNITQFEYQNHNLTTQQLKDLLYQEILLYHFQDFKDKYEQRVNKHQSVIQHILNSSNKENIDKNADCSEDDDD